MANWQAPLRPAAHAEQALVTAILDGTYPPGSELPGERDLAAQMGVTRPTLRETLQRLACEGWLTIHQGKPTRVNDFWRDGGLSVLGALVRYSPQLPPHFVPDLLEVRLALAPAYTRSAVERNPGDVVARLNGHLDLGDAPAAYARFDWKLHRALTLASENPVYTLILNGFAGFYEEMAVRYFELPEARASSSAFYAQLLEEARHNRAKEAGQLAQRVMHDSLRLWSRANQ